jgi:hypothetical protein
MRWFLVFVLMFGCGRGGRREERAEERREQAKSEGRSKDVAREAPEDGTTAALEALGYVSEGNEPLTAEVGVVKNLPSAWPGTNLLVSAHDFEVTLVDMAGEPLHTWKLRPADHPNARSHSFRRAWVLPDGGLLGVVEGSRLMRLNPSGRVVWSSELTHHHDVHLVGDELHTLTREVRRVGALRSKPSLEDQITVLDLDGKVLRQTSVLKSLLRSDYDELIAEAKEEAVDLLHTNSLKLLDGRGAAANPAFAAGNYLVSCRRLSALMVIDPKQEKVVWAQKGPWRAQHDAQILDDGSLMVFDNGGNKESATRIYDLATMEERWKWAAGEGTDYHTDCCGTNTKLPNGNVLFVLTDQGAAWEVTPEGQPVWEYHTPHRVGVLQRKVHRLWDVVRMPPVAELPWFARLKSATPAVPTPDPEAPSQP